MFFFFLWCSFNRGLEIFQFGLFLVLLAEQSSASALCSWFAALVFSSSCLKFSAFKSFCSWKASLVQNLALSYAILQWALSSSSLFSAACSPRCFWAFRSSLGAGWSSPAASCIGSLNQPLWLFSVLWKRVWSLYFCWRLHTQLCSWVAALNALNINALM